MLGHVTALGLLVACLASPPASADDAEIAVEFFHTTCLKPGPDFEGIADQAERLNWTPLSGDFVSELAPIKEVLAFQAWLVKLDDTGTETMVGVSKAKLDGRAVHICTIALVDTD